MLFTFKFYLKLIHSQGFDSRTFSDIIIPNMWMWVADIINNTTHSVLCHVFAVQSSECCTRALPTPGCGVSMWSRWPCGRPNEFIQPHPTNTYTMCEVSDGVEAATVIGWWGLVCEIFVFNQKCIILCDCVSTWYLPVFGTTCT